jgi:hypothetical protein
MAAANTFLPVPVSPVSRIVTSETAARRAVMIVRHSIGLED